MCASGENLSSTGCGLNKLDGMLREASHMARFGHPRIKEGAGDTISFFCCKFKKLGSSAQGIHLNDNL
jgi:hypothetical protein